MKITRIVVGSLLALCLFLRIAYAEFPDPFNTELASNLEQEKIFTVILPEKNDFEKQYSGKEIVRLLVSNDAYLIGNSANMSIVRHPGVVPLQVNVTTDVSFENSNQKKPQLLILFRRDMSEDKSNLSLAPPCFRITLTPNKLYSQIFIEQTGEKTLCADVQKALEVFLRNKLTSIMMN